jgi:hypothetical protein
MANRQNTLMRPRHNFPRRHTLGRVQTTQAAGVRCGRPERQSSYHLDQPTVGRGPLTGHDEPNARSLPYARLALSTGSRNIQSTSHGQDLIDLGYGSDKPGIRGNANGSDALDKAWISPPGRRTISGGHNDRWRHVSSNISPVFRAGAERT